MGVKVLSNSIQVERHGDALWIGDDNRMNGIDFPARVDSVEAGRRLIAEIEQWIRERLAVRP